MREHITARQNISFHSSTYHYQAAVDRPGGITSIRERFAGWAGEYPSASVVFPYHRETKVQDYFCSKCEKKENGSELAALLLLVECPHNHDRKIFRTGRNMACNTGGAGDGSYTDNAAYGSYGDNAGCDPYDADVLVGRKIS
jgi:hypothetical protein